MLRCCGPLSWLLLALMQPAWTVVRVFVPSSPIRAPPGSDVRLPCNFSDSSKPLSLSMLAVMWKIGENIVARYEDGFKSVRSGAVMFVDQLQKGDGTLLLQGVNDSDASVYTCFVIHMPDKGEGLVELKVEAPPRLTLSPTKVQLAELTAVMCTMSDFYPSNITVEWLRNDVVVKSLESPMNLQSRDDGLFNADSVFHLIPNLTDVGANFSCRVHHQALDGPFKKDFQLQVQARPNIQDIIVLKEWDLTAAKCLVSGFYPKEINVQWLRNGKPQETMQSEPWQMPNGTFTSSSGIIQSESDPTASYVCQVSHESLTDSLKLTAHWQTKGSSASPGCSELCSFIWIGLTTVFIASTIGLGAILLYYKIQAKHKSKLGTKGEIKKLEDVKESNYCSESEHLNDSTQVASL